MQLSIKKENVEIVVSDATAEECVLVLKEGLIDLMITQHPRVPIEEVCLDVEVIDQEVIEDHVEANVEPVTYGAEVKKKLVFAKCKRCGNTFCKMLDVENANDDTLKCKCGSVIYINPSHLVQGKYDCMCNTRGNFLMTKDVDKVHCKDCNTPLYMDYNESLDCYIGDSFTTLINNL